MACPLQKNAVNGAKIDTAIIPAGAAVGNGKISKEAKSVACFAAKNLPACSLDKLARFSKTTNSKLKTKENRHR
ncbi:hypothetical protein JQM63_10200 [Oscillibacter valericigenes]|nr:hypothetical protein [Oscillibacter valericigenes]